MGHPLNIERALIPPIQRMADTHSPVSPSAAIYQDLHIAGDDAAELLEEIAARFGTSFSGFNFQVYFPNEHESRSSPRRTMTVSHLVAVIERGAWFEP
jgi:hypothetical protein